MARSLFCFQHSLMVSALLLVNCMGAIAQVTPDATLRDPTVVQRQGDRVVITGGTQAGRKLFHSFRQFSVRRGETASFRGIDPAVELIFARVTGGQLSRINGRIEALQSNGDLSGADLFLLNPNGILFGADASLNLGGSLIATTANSIEFEDGTSFSAVVPTLSPLLTVSVPIGAQFGRSPASIVNRSIAPLVDQLGNRVLDEQGRSLPGGLQVRAGQTLGLLGGDVTLNQGGLLAVGNDAVAGGRVLVGSVASDDRVRLGLSAGEWSFGFGAVDQLGTIRLSSALLNVGGAGGGAIQLRGDRVHITDSEVFADTLTDGAGRGVEITANDLMLDQFSLVSASTFGTGQGGTIRLLTDRLTIRNGAQVEANTHLTGRGGDIFLTARESARLSGGFDLDGNFFPSGLFVRVAAADTTGNSGNLSVVADRLIVEAGAQINIDTQGSGNGGALFIQAGDVRLTGVALNPDGSARLRNNVTEAPSAISANTVPNSRGNGGAIAIAAESLLVSEGAVLQTATRGSGDAGDISLRVRDRVEISGTASGTDVPSGLLTFSGGIAGTRYGNLGVPEATGRGGNLSLQTGELVVRNRAVIAVGSLNPTGEARGAGNLTIRAEQLNVGDRGSLLAETASGDGGNMAFSVDETLSLRQNSLISTTAGTEQTGGDGGSIGLNAGFIVAAPTEDSDIRANAFEGRGGDVTITTQGIIGIAPRAENTRLSDITASSELGVDGRIQINSPNVDPSQGLVALPETVVDASRLVARDCAAGTTVARTIGRFVMTGRGGVPPQPFQQRGEAGELADWAQLTASTVVRLPVDARAEAFTTTQIVEAQGWQRGDRGIINLTADGSASRPSSQWATMSGCAANEMEGS